MFPRGEFAGIAPSGRPVVSGGTTGLEVLEIALANWPFPESTKGGTCNRTTERRQTKGKHRRDVALGAPDLLVRPVHMSNLCTQ